MASKALFPVADQGELTLSRRAEPNDMPIEMVRLQFLKVAYPQVFEDLPEGAAA